jgi:hypothetical protein
MMIEEKESLLAALRGVQRVIGSVGFHDHMCASSIERASIASVGRVNNIGVL